MSDDDIFAGDVEGRLERIDRRVMAVVLDAQCRDWIAERPDRVGFARLGQVHHELRAAIRRYNPIRKADEWVSPVVSTATWLVVTLVILLVADDAGDPLVLAFALVAGLIVAQAAITIHAAIVARAGVGGAGRASAGGAGRAGASGATETGAARKAGGATETGAAGKAGGAAGTGAVGGVGAGRGEAVLRIEDPLFYADLTSRIEACAATARGDSKEEFRAAAEDLGRALDWVSATRDEISRGSSSAGR